MPPYVIMITEGGVFMRDTQQQLQIKKIVIMMRSVFYGQFVIVAVVVLYFGIRFLADRTMPDFTTYVGMLILLILMVLLNAFFLTRDKNLFINFSDRIEQQELSYENVKELNTTLRAQRHDFLNHIQVLYTLMELSEYEETKDYLDNIYKDVGRINSRIKTKSVAVNALLQAKGNEAEGRGVGFDVTIKTRFDRFMIPDWEVCRIIANVIDNALDASLGVNEPVISIILAEKVKSYELCVRNDCMPIENSVKERLFEAGFTTKSNKEGHGMGLYIVKSLLDKYKGSIQLNYKVGSMEVVIEIPKEDN